MHRRPMAIAIAIVVLLVAVVLWWRGRAPEPPPPASPTAPSSAPPAAELPAAEPEPALPELDASDALVREVASSVGIPPLLAALLDDDAVIRRFVRVVDAIASGESPAGELAVLGPKAPFEAAEDEGGWYVDPAGYARYDAVAAAVGSVDADAAVLAYERLEPLFDAAYAESVGESRPFRPVFRRALTVLLETPEPEGPRALEAAVDRFVYRDEALEALSLPQKHLLRMGPANQARIEATLRAVAAALGAS